MLHGGEVALSFAKHHLPNYGVFDEFRYFVPGDTLPVVRVRGVDVALAICEDLWQDGGRVPGGPLGTRRAAALRQRLPVQRTRTTPGWSW
ncbi:Glutamine-dependent NAD(+) synthetase [Streptomyces tendae]